MDLGTVDTPDFIGMAIVLIAHTDSDLLRVGPADLIEDVGAEVEPEKIEARRYSPDLVQLGEGAAADSDLDQ